jgi:peptide/nickel transport system permease protein
MSGIPKMKHHARVQGVVGVSIVGTICVMVVLAPFIAQHAPGALIGEVWAPISRSAWLGLDNLGRDMMSRILYGGRVTLLVALASTAICFFLGTSLGLIAAIRGSWTDAVLSRSIDAVMSIPPLILALVLLSMLGTSIPLLIGALAVISSTRVFRLSRALARDIVVLEYFQVARLRRESLIWLIGYEALPNMLAPLAAEFGLRLCSNFLLLASLSFLGLGIQPPNADWGTLVRDNAAAIGFGFAAPIIPAVAIGLFTTGVNLIVDWILADRAIPGVQ